MGMDCKVGRSTFSSATRAEKTPSSYTYYGSGHTMCLPRLPSHDYTSLTPAPQPMCQPLALSRIRSLPSTITRRKRRALPSITSQLEARNFQKRQFDVSKAGRGYPRAGRPRGHRGGSISRKVSVDSILNGLSEHRMGVGILDGFGALLSNPTGRPSHRMAFLRRIQRDRPRAGAEPRTPRTPYIFRGPWRRPKPPEALSAAIIHYIDPSRGRSSWHDSSPPQQVQPGTVWLMSRFP
jgi:hypothetical protein